MFPLDWLVYAFILMILLVIFFIYLMLRRSILGFKEGYQDSRR